VCAVCVCMFVCMYVCMYVRVYACVYTCEVASLVVRGLSTVSAYIHHSLWFY